MYAVFTIEADYAQESPFCSLAVPIPSIFPTVAVRQQEFLSLLQMLRGNEEGQALGFPQRRVPISRGYKNRPVERQHRNLLGSKSIENAQQLLG
jgi:hypothetical protein